MTARVILDRIMDSLRRRPGGTRRAERLVGLLRTLISERGEVTGAVLARRAVALYRGLDAEGRAHLFDKLAHDFSPDPVAVLQAAVAYHARQDAQNLAALQRVTEPPRQEIFRRMNMAPGGTATLLDLRRELLAAQATSPQLAAVDHDLTHLLHSWFNRGFLELRRIDWNTPASILEKLIAYEAVHRIHGFPDLKRRLERDRRCLAFFHPALPDEPLIFVEVALLDEVPQEVAPILAMESAVADPRKARCAVFYSITSCQAGLKGVSFGNFLIKQVAEDLHAELPGIKVFATLSPVPGFRQWAGKVAAPVAARADADPAAARADLERLAAWYLTQGWSEGHSLDPVARFHLGNGARLERINWMADPSARGMAQSFGLMVNYVYDLGDVERNHEEYVKRHRVVSAPAVEKLAHEAAPLVESVRPAPISSP
jgi:malonyl-CoA decarboxylase